MTRNLADDIERAVKRMTEMKAHNRRERCGRLEFSIEMGRGETYATRDWTIYGHDTYPRSSVMHGRERRSWLACFGPGEEGLAAAKEACKRAGVKPDVWEGSSHTPIDIATAGLEDEDGYPSYGPME
jgi:hypothetical protein